MAEFLKSDVWIRELTYKIKFANVDTGLTEESVHTIGTWGVDVLKEKNGNPADNYVESHVIIGCQTFADEFRNVTVIFVDGTFDVVPRIEGGYQVLTIMAEHLSGEVVIVSIFPMKEFRQNKKSAFVEISQLKKKIDSNE